MHHSEMAKIDPGYKTSGMETPSDTLHVELWGSSTLIGQMQVSVSSWLCVAVSVLLLPDRKQHYAGGSARDDQPETRYWWAATGVSRSLMQLFVVAPERYQFVKDNCAIPVDIEHRELAIIYTPVCTLLILHSAWYI